MERIIIIIKTIIKNNCALVYAGYIDMDKNSVSPDKIRDICNNGCCTNEAPKGDANLIIKRFNSDFAYFCEGTWYDSDGIAFSSFTTCYHTMLKHTWGVCLISIYMNANDTKIVTPCNVDNLLIDIYSERIRTLSEICVGSYFVDSLECEESDCYAFKIDGEYYYIYQDADDGYRSYGYLKNSGPTLHPLIKVITRVNIPNQRVYIKRVQHENNQPYAAGPKVMYGIYNADTNEVIAEVGTDYYEEYYPMSIMHYYPENLTCNKCNK